MYKLFDFKCTEGHIVEQLVNGQEPTAPICGVCRSPAHQIFTPTVGRALYFEEGRTRTIQNLETLGPGNVSNGPVRVSSRKQHQEAMKRAGVCEAGVDVHHNHGQAKGRWI